MTGRLLAIIGFLALSPAASACRFAQDAQPAQWYEWSTSLFAADVASVGNENEKLKADAAGAREQNEKLRIDAANARAESEMLKAAAVTAKDENEKLTADAASARAESERVKADAAITAEENQRLRADAASARNESERLRADAASARDDNERLKADAAHARDENERLKADAANARDEVAKWRRGVEQAQADAETARAEAELVRARAEQDVALARGEIEAARHATATETERVRKAAAAEAEQALDAAAAEAEQAFAARLTAADAVNQRKLAEVVERGESAIRRELERAARLGDALRSIDEAGGLSDVLERVVQCAANEVDRAAMLIVKGDRLTGWRLAGFSPDAPPAKSIDLGLEEAGLAGVVVESGTACLRPADAADGPSLPPFAADRGGRLAMAFPVLVGGDVVAVLYADAHENRGTLSSDARWPAILEVLIRHASRVVEAMTVQQAAGLPLRRPASRAFTAAPGSLAHAGSGEQQVVGGSP